MHLPGGLINTVFAVGRQDENTKDERHKDCETAPAAGLPSKTAAKIGRTLQERMMEKWQTTLRVEKIRREIAEIQAANRTYKSQIAHTVGEIAHHQKRQIRLQEIMGELKILSGQATEQPKTSSGPNR
jgi:hypothetical protein